MKIKRREDVPPVAVEGCAGVTKRIVLGQADGSDEIVLRCFSLAEGASTPRHTHDFPHLVRIETGQGVTVNAHGDESPVGVGDYVYVAPNEMHNFRNTGTDPFDFICIVPARGEPPAAT